MPRTLLAAICVMLTLGTVSGAAAGPETGRLLSVRVVGGGQITSNDGRIDCGTRCTASYRKGSVRRLTASAREGFEFVKWEGDCIGTAAICEVALDRKQQATASFLGEPTPLRLSVGGPGRIVGSDFRCGGRDSVLCGTDVPHGTTVTLTPEAAADGRFAGWDGPCADSGTGRCTLPIVSPVEIAAAFGHASPSPGEQPFTVTLSGRAHVASQPSGIDCPPTCSTSFQSGTLVTLTMNSGSEWAGGCWGFVLRCRLVVDSPTNVVAATIPPPPVPFSQPEIPPPPPNVAYLDVTVSGKGLVMSFRRLSCGRAPNPRRRCRDFAYLGGTYVLHAVRRRGTYFARWGGDCRGKKPTCRIAVAASGSPTYAVTGLFRLKR